MPATKKSAGDHFTSPVNSIAISGAINNIVAINKMMISLFPGLVDVLLFILKSLNCELKIKLNDFTKNFEFLRY